MSSAISRQSRLLLACSVDWHLDLNYLLASLSEMLLVELALAFLVPVLTLSKHLLDVL